MFFALELSFEVRSEGERKLEEEVRKCILGRENIKGPMVGRGRG